MENQTIPVTPTPTALPPKKSKLPLIIGVVVVLGLIGGGVYAFVLPNTSPAVMLKKSLEKSIEVKSLAFTATTTGKVENAGDTGLPSASDFTLTANGAVDITNPESRLFDINLGINASVQASSTTGSLVLGLNALSVDKKFYLNLKNFNASYSSTDPKEANAQMVVMMANGFASSLTNKWILFTANNVAMATSTESVISAEEKALIKEYIDGMSYVKDISKVGKETLGDAVTTHLKVTIQNGKEFEELVRKIEAARGEEPDERSNDFIKLMSQEIVLDVWVGKNDGLVHKIVTSPVIATDTKTGTKTTTSQEVMFSNFNAPLNVTAPADAIPFEQMVQGLFGGMGAM